MFIQTEETPNPNTLKFLPGKVILKEDSLEFKTKDEAKSNILAESLFEDDNVSGVFIGKDFVTITKSKDTDWDLVKPNLLAKIHDFLVSGQTFEKKVKRNHIRKNTIKKIMK